VVQEAAAMNQRSMILPPYEMVYANYNGAPHLREEWLAERGRDTDFRIGFGTDALEGKDLFELASGRRKPQSR
jgi:hypothetical protein